MSTQNEWLGIDLILIHKQQKDMKNSSVNLTNFNKYGKFKCKILTSSNIINRSDHI